MLCVTMLASCGSNKNNTTNTSSVADAEATPYIPEEVPSKFKASLDNIEKTENGVTVSLDKREGDDRYSFENEDLGFVDTKSGALLKLGMTSDEIESLIGKPKSIDLEYRVYDGIVIEYNNDMETVKLIVASGNMKDDDESQRFVTPRGLTLMSSFDDFTNVYGDEYYPADTSDGGENSGMNGATRAVRYYAKDGSSYSYIGQGYTKDTKPEDDKNLISQMFIFEPGSNSVSAITVQTGEAK